MPRYFFDTDDGRTPVDDTRGYALKNLDAARRFAQDALADMARDAVPGDGDHRTMTVRVRDESGGTVMTASLVLTIVTTQPPAEHGG